jgi:hypothetical protein
MKRLGVWLCIFALLIVATGCAKDKKSKTDTIDAFFDGLKTYNVEKMTKTDTIDAFFDGLKTYNVEKMTQTLDRFPDNKGYVYLDDIFNDERYIDIYRSVYPEISYSIKEIKGDYAIVSVKIPDIQSLYTDVTALVTSMTLEDEELLNKLMENETNGIILVQEMMYGYVNSENYQPKYISKDFKLSFKTMEGKTVIVCDDELRALMTGNFFLSKNMKPNG